AARTTPARRPSRCGRTRAAAGGCTATPTGAIATRRTASDHSGRAYPDTATRNSAGTRASGRPAATSSATLITVTTTAPGRPNHSRPEPRRAVRHPVDHLDRLRRSLARRILPAALFDRAGLVRPRHARDPRRTARARAHRRRRVDAPIRVA